MSYHGSVAKAVRERKERHPELYCRSAQCLWRLASGPCPRHIGSPAVCPCGKRGDGTTHGGSSCTSSAVVERKLRP